MVDTNWPRLIYKLVIKNEKNLRHNTPYTAEKPNFAILISIVKNYEKYIKVYGLDFLKEILMYFEEAAFTGIFGKDGGINIPKYYNVVYKNLTKYLKYKVELIELTTISNTLVLRFLEEIRVNRSRSLKRSREDTRTSESRDNRPRSVKRSREYSRSSESRDTKRRRGEGIQKRRTKHKRTKHRRRKQK